MAFGDKGVLSHSPCPLPSPGHPHAPHILSAYKGQSLLPSLSFKYLSSKTEKSGIGDNNLIEALPYPTYMYMFLFLKLP